MPTYACLDCGDIKPAKAFYRDRQKIDGVRRYCIPCYKLRGRQAKLSPVGRMKWLARYGIDLVEYDRLLDQQGGVCPICGTDNPGRGSGGQRLYFSVDHDHETGRVRGLLCSRCNLAIGSFEDRAQWLTAAARYLHREVV